jgi:endonuclease/exonuclease/phosphatase family metal-dependent hydrolase
VTWIRFRDEQSGREFCVLNTHLDHEVQRSRECSAALILERIADFDDALPLIVTGDFNAAAGDNPVYDSLVTRGPLRDAWLEACGREPPLGTYHAFDGLDTDSDRGRIDWILTRGAIEAIAAEVVTCSRAGQYPSDHFPVQATLHIG